MEDKNFNFLPLYLILGSTAIILILSGIFLPNFLNAIQVELSTIIVKCLQFGFIISGILDFVLLVYAKKKLN